MKFAIDKIVVAMRLVRHHLNPMHAINLENDVTPHVCLVAVIVEAGTAITVAIVFAATLSIGVSMLSGI